MDRVTCAAGDFFLESLSSFEMVQRGFAEAHQAFIRQRRQTELSRQLSSFLTDASLALDASDTLEEMLRLVAEQARELVGAECCLATVTLEGDPCRAEGASHPEPDTQWKAFVRWLDLFAIYRHIRLHGGSVRIAGEELAHVPAFRAAAIDRTLHGWLPASLTALDGSELGAIHLFDKDGGDFTEDDEAALVHLARRHQRPSSERSSTKNEASACEASYPREVRRCRARWRAGLRPALLRSPVLADASERCRNHSEGAACRRPTLRLRTAASGR